MDALAGDLVRHGERCAFAATTERTLVIGLAGIAPIRLGMPQE
jgi:hypothetical protein